MSDKNSSKKREYIKDNAMKEKEIKMIENLFPKKYSKEYIDKLSILLKKKDPNYIKKRKNMNKVQLSVDENNNLYLTLTSFGVGKKSKKQKTPPKIEKQLSSPKKQPNKSHRISINAKQTSEIEEETNEYKINLQKLIPEFYDLNESSEDSTANKYNFNQLSKCSSEASINEFEHKALYNKLTSKYKLYANNEITQSQNLDKSSNLNSKREMSKKSANSFKNSLLKNSLKNSLPIIDDYNKGTITSNIRNMRDNIHLIESTKNGSGSPKQKLHAIDLFNYDKEKWQNKFPKDSNRFVNKIKNFEEKREKVIKKLKNDNEKIVLNLPKMKFMSTKDIHNYQGKIINKYF